MKKHLLTLVLFLLPVFATQAFADDLTGNVGISLYGGVSMPTNGEFSATDAATDVLNVGPQFGLGFSYFFNEGLGVELMGNYGFNYLKDDYKPAGMEPVFTNISVSLNGVYNFGHLLDNSFISPVARAGVGLYSWSQLDDGLGGDAVQVGSEDLSGSSFGFNVGIGADFKVMESLSVGLMLDYNMYFPQDEDKFGKDFAEQGYFSPQLKVTYYIPTK